MSEFNKQIEIITEDMDKEAERITKIGLQKFLGAVAGISRQLMVAGKTVGIRTGFLAESLKSEHTPEKYKTYVPDRSPGGWNPKDYHVEEIVVGDDSLKGEIGTEVWYARIQSQGGRAGRDHSVTIEPTPFLEPAFEIAKTEAVGMLLEGAFE